VDKVLTITATLEDVILVPVIIEIVENYFVRLVKEEMLVTVMNV